MLGIHVPDKCPARAAAGEIITTLDRSKGGRSDETAATIAIVSNYKKTKENVSRLRSPKKSRNSTIGFNPRAKLDAGRLAKDDVFYREPKSEGERHWLAQNRFPEAEHWNLLTDMKSEQLQYAQ
jgi:hypothetical protein